jgi:uncharacterized surface protein with fasciclin (FAS1) repeats
MTHSARGFGSHADEGFRLIRNRRGGLMAYGIVTSVRNVLARTILVGALFTSPLGMANAQTVSTNQDAWTMLENNPNFSDVVALVKRADLGRFMETNRFTAFLPTNAAFDKNPGVLSVLLQEQTGGLPDTTTAVVFMRSHAIYDIHPLSEFSGRSVTLTSISGSPIEIDGTHPDKYTVRWISVQSKIGTAHVVDSPIVTSNAIIYPVDTVILIDLGTL